MFRVRKGLLSRSALYKKRKREVEKEFREILNENNQDEASGVLGNDKIENTNEIVNDNVELENQRLTNHVQPLINSTLVDRNSDEEISDTNCDKDDVIYDKEHLQKGLAEICIQNNITRNVATSILKLLRPHLPHYTLPKDSRTLLNTPRCVYDRDIAGGKYHHFGLENSLVHACQGKSFLDNEDVKVLSLQVNIDGLPVFKSCNSSLWPILCRVYCGKDICTSPFVVGLFFGESKPLIVDEFLGDFCDDYLSLKESGITIANKHFAVEISCFICDAPARAYVKRVKSHSGYHGCDRCTAKGEWIADAVRLVDTNASLRTDESFLLQSDKKHHLGTSCLKNLGVGLVTGFPVEYMHLVALGVMRRLMYAWTRGKNYKCLLGPKQREEISNYLLALRPFCPSEFSRLPRKIKELDRWKATEFRTFLLYTGIFVMGRILKGEKLKPLYDNFILLSCAVRMLLNDETCVRHNNFADVLLKRFVKGCTKLYGKDFVTYNIHALVHLPSDALKFGNLENVSAFPFENYLQKVKKFVKGSNGALAQVVKRIQEERSLPPTSKSRKETILLRRTTGKPCPIEMEEAGQFFGVIHKDVRYSIMKRDNCIMTHDSIALIVNVLQIGGEGGEVKMVLRKFSTVKSLFVEPLDSTIMGIVQVDGLKGMLDVISLSDVKNKCFRMTLGTTTVAVGYTSLRQVCIHIIFRSLSQEIVSIDSPLLFLLQNCSRFVYHNYGI